MHQPLLILIPQLPAPRLLNPISLLLNRLSDPPTHHLSGTLNPLRLPFWSHMVAFPLHPLLPSIGEQIPGSMRKSDFAELQMQKTSPAHNPMDESD